MDVWERIKRELALRLAPEAYDNWLAGTRLDRVEGQLIYVKVPDETSRLWVQDEYGELVLETIRQLRLPYTNVVYVCHGSNGQASPWTSGPDRPVEPLEVDLNPRYTFQTFVVGASNQFAHAAARAVAERPGRAYNPLFIYGATGLGKTHLLHAIGHFVREAWPNLRLVCTTAERFTNQLIRCLRNDQMALFHECYRRADVLLVDDIQVLANKERTQEEFFHTFNELYEQQKQIVITSDAPPTATPGIVDRLRSRFEWGLLVDIQPPDLETKLAILEKKAELEGIDLPEDVRVFIATHTRSNVRELEAALTRLVAYTSVLSCPITLDLARQLLRDLSHQGGRVVTIDVITRAVAQEFSLQPQELKQKCNARRVSFPRQVAMYLAKKLTSMSYPEIGRYFGGKHHTTVLHAVEKIGKLCERDPEINRLINRLIDSLS